jgi:hypothetical protein
MLARNKIESTLGKTFAETLDTSVFTVGHWGYTRRDMVDTLGCANFIAAARLARALKRLQIQSPSQLHKMDPFSLVRIRGIGEACLFVAMCILDASGYSVEDWWGWKQDKDNIVKFSAFKHKATMRATKKNHAA